MQYHTASTTVTCPGSVFVSVRQAVMPQHRLPQRDKNIVHLEAPPWVSEDATQGFIPLAHTYVPVAESAFRSQGLLSTEEPEINKDNLLSAFIPSSWTLENTDSQLLFDNYFYNSPVLNMLPVFLTF